MGVYSEVLIAIESKNIKKKLLEFIGDAPLDVRKEWNENGWVDWNFGKNIFHAEEKPSEWIWEDSLETFDNPDTLFYRSDSRKWYYSEPYVRLADYIWKSFMDEYHDNEYESDKPSGVYIVVGEDLAIQHDAFGMKQLARPKISIEYIWER